MSVKILELDSLSDVLKADLPIRAKISILRQLMNVERFNFFIVLCVIEIIEMMKLELAEAGEVTTEENNELYDFLVGMDISYTAKENHDLSERIYTSLKKVVARKPTHGPGRPFATDKMSLILTQGLLIGLDVGKVNTLNIPMDAIIPICDNLKTELNMPVEGILATCLDMALEIDTSLGEVLKTGFTNESRTAEVSTQSADVLH